jgi:pyridoxine 4-dehydrogenase
VKSSAETTLAGIARPGGAGLLGDQYVSRIGYGAMQLGRLHGERGAALALLRRAVELGVDHVDTAQFYGNGFVNGLIRDALRPEDGVTIVSKVGAVPVPDSPYPLPAQRPEQLRAAVESNLTGLGLDRIPVVNLRRFDVGPGGGVEGEQIVDLDDQLAEMIVLRDEGKIGAVGLSSVTIDILRRALPAGIACVQNAYSLVTRDDEAMLRLCIDERIAWVPYFPLGSAIPSFPKVTDEPTVVAIAGTLGKTPAQVGLAWLLHHAPNVLLIPGTTHVGHLEENTAAGRITFERAALDSLGAVPPHSPDYPGG